MKRLFFLFLLVLTACSGGGAGPPRNLDDACYMQRERPSWFRAMRKTERRWGVPVYVQMATFHQESLFKPQARTPRKYMFGFIPNGRISSAYGYSQALNGTWKEYQKDTGKRRAKRDRFADASDFMGWYMSKTQERNAIPLSDAYHQYLAYHEGHTGFARGSYRRKGWLVGVAGKVQARARMYRDQLAGC